MLDKVERASAHGDLGEVLFRQARRFGMRVVALSSQHYPALVATASGSDLIVAAAFDQHALLLRVGSGPPPNTSVRHDPVPDLGPEWWRVNPFDASVSVTDLEAELTRWFAAAVP